MFTKILVAVDGRKLSEKVTAYALRLAESADVHFVCAVDPNGFFSDAASAVFDAANDRESAIQAAQRVVDRCVDSARNATLKVTAEAVSPAR